MVSLSGHLFDKNSQESKKLDILLKPSWLSGLLAVIAGAVIVFGAIGLVSYSGSDIKLLVDLHSEQSKSVGANTQAIDAQYSDNRFISSIPLFVFWSGVGLIAYSLTMAAFGKLQDAAELSAEMEYVHADKLSLRRHAVERVLLRAIALLVWILFVQITLHLILPYALAVAYSATGSMPRLTAGGLILWGIGLLAITAHIHTVLFRLLLLRARVFGQVTVPESH